MSTKDNPFKSELFDQIQDDDAAAVDALALDELPDELASELFNSMLKSTISDTWSGAEPLSLMTLAMDVVESLFGLEARDQGEVALFTLEKELADELDPGFGDATPITGQTLLAALYGPLGFKGDWERFFAVDNCLMDRVVSRRRGIPVSMAVLVLYLCERYGIRAEGISFPGHFLLRIFDEPAALPTGEFGLDDEINLQPPTSSQIIDPFTGQPLTQHATERILRGARGNLAKLTPAHLKPAEPVEVLMRLLNVTKASFIHHQHFTHALMCSQLLLKLDPDCPFERRDRGFLYEQLECNQLAVEDFEFFIEHCPEDPLADILKIQVAALGSLPNVVH